MFTLYTKDQLPQEERLAFSLLNFIHLPIGETFIEYLPCRCWFVGTNYHVFFVMIVIASIIHGLEWKSTVD